MDTFLARGDACILLIKQYYRHDLIITWAVSQIIIIYYSGGKGIPDIRIWWCRGLSNRKKKKQKMKNCMKIIGRLFVAFALFYLVPSHGKFFTRKRRRGKQQERVVIGGNNKPCEPESYEFYWSGQFAGFIVNGRFSYNKNAVPASGIVREEDLLYLDVSFFDPQGKHLRTYSDNQKTPIDGRTGKPYLNFAFDVLTKEILQDGTWKVDDDTIRYRNGFMMGEGNPDLRTENGVQSGLAFWSRPGDDKTPHLHVDDWNDEDGKGEFHFPIGYSTHEDASFQYRTTQRQIDGGKVGAAYLDNNNSLASDVDAFGKLVRVIRTEPSLKDRMRCEDK